jgi:YVTN family beta-propeller protein
LFARTGLIFVSKNSSAASAGKHSAAQIALKRLQVDCKVPSGSSEFYTIPCWKDLIGGTSLRERLAVLPKDALSSSRPVKQPALLLLAAVALCQNANHLPKPGVATPGVRIPIARLKPLAVFPVAGAPDWIAVDESVWISNYPKDRVTRLDAKTNQVAATIPTGKQPCSGLAVGFGSLWVPSCGDHNLARIDLKTGKLTATVPVSVADSEGGIAAGASSIWLLTDGLSTLARVDPDTNRVVAEIRVAAGSFTVALGEGAVWVTSTSNNLLTRIDPLTNLIVETITVGKSPRFLAVGEGAVWVLNQGDGSVSRVDPKTNKVVATIQVEVPGPGGDIAPGEGSVWVTSFDFPISRIDPSSNRVVQQFTGDGGDAIRVGLGSVWLSNLRAQNVWRIDPKRIQATLPD